MVQIVDARNPLTFRCDDLETYVADLEGSEGEQGTGPGKRRNLLLINKADLLTAKQRYVSRDTSSSTFAHVLPGLYGQIISRLVGSSMRSSLRPMPLPFKRLVAKRPKHLKHKQLQKLVRTQNPRTRGPMMTRRRTPTTILNIATTLMTMAPSSLLNQRKTLKILGHMYFLFLNWKTSSNPQHLRCPVHFFFVSRHWILTSEIDFVDQSGSAPTALVVGLVGYPNVGKSSTINALIGEKKVSVSATPGKTKHFQTLNLSDEITLCDCPGLVFPQFATTKAALICDGVLPIDQMKEYTGPTGLLVQRIPKEVLEAIYGLAIPVKIVEEGGTGVVTASDLLIAYAGEVFPNPTIDTH